MVRVGRKQTVGRKAVAQRVVAGFVVPQVQKGWLREVGRRYRRNLIVFIALALAVIGLKTSERQGRVSASEPQNPFNSISNSGNGNMALGKGMTPTRGRRPGDLLLHPSMNLPPTESLKTRAWTAREQVSLNLLLISQQIWPTVTREPPSLSHPPYRGGLGPKENGQVR